MITFTRPLFFIFLFGIPLYWFLIKIKVLKKIEIPLTFEDWDGYGFHWKNTANSFLHFISLTLIHLAFVILVFAAAGPARFVQEKVFAGSGSAILFAIDVSPSMAATDFSGETRLEISKSYISSFVNKRLGDSFGLVAFGSEASLLIPPTTDHATFLKRLDSLSIGEFGDGTAIGMGLAVAMAHIRDQNFTHKSVILLTDGENNVGEISPKTAALLYREHGVSLFVTGIGSQGDVPVDYVDPTSGVRFTGMLSSDFNEASLKEIAEIAKGTYVHAFDFKTLEYVFSLADNLIPLNSVSWMRTTIVHLEKILILIGVGLVLGSWFIKRIVLRSLL